jgi:1-aminocyclopropane-1-carboxylate deaminase/D-cysteine desulfhydrase-like pyridoxal-dependent ACC family enzyme
LVKRDDQTGLALGGNKTRKLELLIAEAQEQQARTIITAGAIQSNHCRQTAAAAVKFGFECTLVLTGEQPEKPSGNLFLDYLLGANIVWTEGQPRELMLQSTYAACLEQGKEPYLIPYGGSNPTGVIAYALAMQELIHQNIHADWIVVASSSGGTQAGMVLGARLFGFQGSILGISIDEPANILKERVANLANASALELGVSASFSPEEIIVNADYLGEGYGKMGALEKEAIRTFARLEGLFLDPVYTGRAAGGMLDLMKKGYFPRNSSVLFWHTGGSPALFAQAYQDNLS